MGHWLLIAQLIDLNYRDMIISISSADCKNRQQRKCQEENKTEPKSTWTTAYHSV